MSILTKIDNFLSESNDAVDDMYKKYKKVEGNSAIDGMSKQKAKNELYKATKPHWYNRIYKDAYWEGPHNIFKEFDKMNLNWHLEKAEYKQEHGVNVRKEWKFQIIFDNDKGKQNMLYGHLTASGAGSVDDPLEKYDLIFVVS